MEPLSGGSAKSKVCPLGTLLLLQGAELLQEYCLVFVPGSSPDSRGTFGKKKITFTLLLGLSIRTFPIHTHCVENTHCKLSFDVHILPTYEQYIQCRC
ncbi:hypothetical protein HOLleu_07490 [Holothuria leucospilota]|uniref:Uncharacterized protein n=1 Tax=Holothuria leucospilota TaxID=206669 RepID=A0A9Q1CHA2_HOLLE|nr:hypothetical protein HOLleu_07490 [Holothuria leucospilota]